MTGEHDYDITVQPFVCRRCHKSRNELYDVMTDSFLSCAADSGTYRPRHSADDYQGIAERLKDLGYQKWISE
jgi:hypothetical protein